MVGSDSPTASKYRGKRDRHTTNDRQSPGKHRLGSCVALLHRSFVEPCSGLAAMKATTYDAMDYILKILRPQHWLACVHAPYSTLFAQSSLEI